MFKTTKSWWDNSVGKIGDAWSYFWENYEISPKKKDPEDFLLPIVGLGIVFIVVTKWKPR